MTSTAAVRVTVLVAIFASAVLLVVPVGRSATDGAALSRASREQGPDPYPVIPDPPFVVPAGGSSRKTELGGGQVEISLFRGDGSLYARRVEDSLGRPHETTYYRHTDGIAYLSIYAEYDSAEQAFRTLAVVSPNRRSQGNGPAKTRRLASHFAVTCGGQAYSVDNQRWHSTMGWYWNEASTPANLDHTLTLNALRNSRVEWESEVNYCNYADGSSMNFTYQGTTTAGYGSNGINTVGFGNMSQTGCGSTAIACSRVDKDAFTIYEADIRLKYQDDFWANNGAHNRHDVQHIMAHDTGHNIGFNHVADSTNVMYTGIAEQGNTSGRKLGNGDAVGVDLAY